MQIFYIFLIVVSVEAGKFDLENTLLKISKSLEDVKRQLNDLQTAFEQKTNFVSNGCSIKEITDAIESRKFELAGELLSELSNKNKIAQIVHVIYANSPANVDLILDFVKKLRDGGDKFRVLSALQEEMRTSGNSDPFKLIILIDTMEKALAKEQNATPDVKAKAHTALKSAIETVKDTSVNMLKTAMINNRYENNAEVEALTNTIFKFRTDLSDEIIEWLVDSVFGVVAARKILNNISSHEHTQQVIRGLLAIFNRFNYAGNLNNDAILDLSAHLKKLQDRHDYPNMDETLRQEIDGIIERLPTCARNLYFHKDICLWNRGKGAYMFAASSEYNFDKERRSIFIGHTGSIVNGAIWHVEKIGDYYFFKNSYYSNEYMYSLAGNPRDTESRFVFTWIPGHNTDEQSRFTIELDGNYCYIKSAYINEYLFASSVKYNKFNSYVFTWARPTVVRSADFQWELRNCNHGN